MAVAGVTVRADHCEDLSLTDLLVGPFMTSLDAQELAVIVHRALAIRPDDRFQSIAEMMAPLRALAPHGIKAKIPSRKN